MTTLTRRMALAGLALFLVLAGAGTAQAETTLEKIARTGTFVVGTRTGSPPFGFIDKQNNWGRSSASRSSSSSRSPRRRPGSHF